MEWILAKDNDRPNEGFWFVTVDYGDNNHQVHYMDANRLSRAKFVLAWTPAPELPHVYDEEDLGNWISVEGDTVERGTIEAGSYFTCEESKYEGDYEKYVFFVSSDDEPIDIKDEEYIIIAYQKVEKPQPYYVEA